MKIKKIKKIELAVSKQDQLIRFALLLFGSFLSALNYNLFFMPHDLVVGGVSGLALIANDIWKIAPAIFMLVVNVILIIISFISLGKNKTMMSILGSILYPILISLTLPLSLLINVNFDNMFLTILVAAIINGITSGIVYKSGYTTGGTDIVAQLLEKYMKISMGKAITYVNTLIIALGLFFFGFDKLLYVIIIVYLNGIIADKIVLGISDSKMFFIYTKKLPEVKAYILNELNTGVSIVKSQGGYSKENTKMIICVVSSRDYYRCKNAILNIDPTAFFIINDCYEVLGGVKNKTR